MWEALGSVLQGIGAVGGAWAAYDNAQNQNRLNKKLLKQEEQRMNRDQAAQRSMAAAFGANEDEQKVYEQRFDFS
ncbi:MAG: hypothetical protein LBO72_11075 [Helicobacteraceae bacterium]|jgi:hypothetical protein|nr:hypothetical protein [Helicobacteraceae bacterium]